jgi:drug/metabolite transporter (DMT)-like permease
VWFKVVSLFPATIASIGALVTPVIGRGSSALLLGEPIGWREVAALGLVLSAVALVIFRPAPRPAAA